MGNTFLIIHTYGWGTIFSIIALRLLPYIVSSQIFRISDSSTPNSFGRGWNRKNAFSYRIVVEADVWKVPTGKRIAERKQIFCSSPQRLSKNGRETFFFRRLFRRYFTEYALTHSYRKKWRNTNIFRKPNRLQLFCRYVFDFVFLIYHGTNPKSEK